MSAQAMTDCQRVAGRWARCCDTSHARAVAPVSRAFVLDGDLQSLQHNLVLMVQTRAKLYQRLVRAVVKRRVRHATVRLQQNILATWLSQNGLTQITHSTEYWQRGYRQAGLTQITDITHPTNARTRPKRLQHREDPAKTAPASNMQVNEVQCFTCTLAHPLSVD